MTSDLPRPHGVPVLQALRNGPAGAARIAFLHGVGSDATAWAPQMAAFPGHEAIAFDMPGYRGSPPHPAENAEALAGLVLDALADDPAPAHVVGLSLGAIVAAHVAALAPRAVATLTLASGFLSYPDGAAVTERSRQAAAGGMPQLAAARSGRVVHAASPPAVRATVAATMGAIPADAYCRMANAVWTADLAHVTPRIRAPTLVVQGADDPVTPPALGRILAAAIPGARMHIIAGASHLANLDQPSRFNDALRRHLGGA